MTTFGLDALGAGLWTGACGPRGGAQPSEGEPCVSSMLLPLYLGEPLVSLEAAREHRRGSGRKWPPEAQVPVLGVAENGWGRRHLAELWERLQAPKGVADRTAGYSTEVSWRPDGAKAITLGAEKLLCHAIRSFPWAKQPEGVLGLVVPEDLAPHGQQLLIDGLGGADKVMLTPAAVLAALAWCRQELAKEGHRAPKEQKTLGYLDVIDVGLGRWGVARFDVVLHKHEGEACLSPLRSSGARAYPADGTTGLEWLAKGMESSGGVLSSEKAESALFHGHPLTLGAAVQSLRKQLKQLESLLRDFPMPFDGVNYGRCLGTLVIGGMEGVQMDGVPFIKLIDEAFSLHGDHEVMAGDVLAQSAAYVAGGRTHGWPTWLERLEPIEFHCHQASPEGDMMDRWIRVADSNAIDAAREFRADDIVDGELLIQAGATSLLQHLRVPGKPDVIKRAHFLLNGRDAATSVTLHLRARPGQGYAIIEIKDKEGGALVSTLDWGRMETVDGVPPLQYGYIPQVMTHEYHPNFESGPALALDEFLDAAERLSVRGRILPYAAELRQQLGKWTSATRMPPGSVSHADRQRPFVIYSLIPLDVEGVANSGMRAKLRRMLRHAEAISEERARDLGPTDDVCEALDLLLGWTYRSCPGRVVERRLRRVLGSPSVRPVDLAVVGLSLADEESMGLVADRIMQEIAAGSANNNWYRCLRNLSRYNQHALRHATDAVLESGIRGLITIIRHAAMVGRPAILRNCVETMVHVLKRRRYSKDFLDVQSRLCRDAKAALNEALRTGDFTPAIRKQLESTLLLVDKKATLENIVVAVDLDGA